jgi:hypothetical protein
MLLARERGLVIDRSVAGNVRPQRLHAVEDQRSRKVIKLVLESARLEALSCDGYIAPTGATFPAPRRRLPVQRRRSSGNAHTPLPAGRTAFGEHDERDHDSPYAFTHSIYGCSGAARDCCVYAPQI